jgi:hypothetical protein
MASAMKLYSHALAPNPRRVRIFAAEKGIELAVQDIDILAGQSRTPEFLAKNPSGGVPVLELDQGVICFITATKSTSRPKAKSATSKAGTSCRGSGGRPCRQAGEE